VLAKRDRRVKELEKQVGDLQDRVFMLESGLIYVANRLGEGDSLNVADMMDFGELMFGSGPVRRASAYKNATAGGEPLCTGCDAPREDEE
jgi:hypothetical protein